MRLADKLREISTRSGLAGLTLNGAALAAGNPDPVQLVLQVLLGLLQLYDVFRREPGRAD